MREARGNVLVFTFARRGEERILRSILARLRERFPSTRICAVGTPASESLLREMGFEHIIIYARGQSARRVIQEAQLCMPEGIAIIYNTANFSGHLKLEATAFLIGAREYVRCPPEGDSVRISRFRLGAAIFGKMWLLFGRLLVGSIVAVLACSVLCWHRYRGGTRRASRT